MIYRGAPTVIHVSTDCLLRQIIFATSDDAPASRKDKSIESLMVYAVTRYGSFGDVVK